MQPIHAPAADQPTRREHYWCFDDDGIRLTKAGGDQGDANGAKDEADYKDYDRVECARLGRLEYRTRRAVNGLRGVRQTVPRKLHRPREAVPKAAFCESIYASWAAARMYHPACRLGRGLHHPSASRKSMSRTRGKPVWC